MYVCVYVYVCVCIYIYVCMHVCMYAYVYAFMCIYKYTNIQSSKVLFTTDAKASAEADASEKWHETKQYVYSCV